MSGRDKQRRSTNTERQKMLRAALIRKRHNGSSDTKDTRVIMESILSRDNDSQCVIKALVGFSIEVRFITFPWKM